MSQARAYGTSLVAPQLKRASIKAVAHARFQDDDKKIFDAVWKKVNSFQATRDRIAHWLWGDTDDFADGMVIVDPKQTLLKSGEIFGAIGRSTKPEAGYASDTVYLHRARDLTRDLDSFKRARNWIFLLAALAAGDNPKPDEIRTQLTTDAHLGIS